MEASILKSVKAILGISEDDTAFDLSVLTFINTTFSDLAQLGIGPAAGFFVESDQANWDQFEVPPIQLNKVRAYMYLRVRAMFDPPATSFAIEAMKEQIAEHEWRLNVSREEALHPLEEGVA